MDDITAPPFQSDGVEGFDTMPAFQLNRFHEACATTGVELVDGAARDEDVEGIFADLLVNSANDGLVGAQAPYFERGGGLPTTAAVPAWAKSSNWCGSTAGLDMLYPVQCVDGLVHQKCGDALRRYLLDDVNFPVLHADSRSSFGEPWGDSAKRCGPGDVVWSPSFGELAECYPWGILHTVAPYYVGEDAAASVATRNTSAWPELLHRAYLQVVVKACEVAAKRSNSDCRQGRSPSTQTATRRIRIAVPFLGTGVKAIPLAEGADTAARAMIAARSRLMESNSADGDRKDGNHSTIDIRESAGSRINSSSGSIRTQLEIKFVSRERDDDVLACVMESFSRVWHSPSGLIP